MPVIPTWLAWSLRINGSFSCDFVARSLDSLPAGRVYWCVPQPAGEPLMFKVGEKVVYPNHGVGLVEQVSVGAMNGRTENCYLLRIASSGLKVMVPESNIKCVGLRRTVRSSEIVEIVAYLERGKCSNHHDWKFRFKQNSEKMRTGSLLSVAEVLKSLVVLSKGKPLSFREKKMMDA